MTNTMSVSNLARRNAWRSLSKRDKQRRLHEMRRRHQAQVEFEILRLL